MVQSMPWGRFAHELEEELVAKRVLQDITQVRSQTPPTPPVLPPPSFPPSPPSTETKLNIGTEVVIEGLNKLKEFNGRLGMVSAYDEETGRYIVLLEQTGDSPTNRAKVKLENLRQRFPPPPAHDASTVLPRPGCLSTSPSSSCHVPFYSNITSGPGIPPHEFPCLLGWSPMCSPCALPLSLYGLV